MLCQLIGCRQFTSQGGLITAAPNPGMTSAPKPGFSDDLQKSASDQNTAAPNSGMTSAPKPGFSGNLQNSASDQDTGNHIFFSS